MSYVLSAAGERDLMEIVSYIADDNPAAAMRVYQDMVARFELLATRPRLGRSRPEIAPTLRSLPVGNYVVFYRIERDVVQIARVLHGARNFADLDI